MCGTELEDRGAGDALGAGDEPARLDRAVADDEDVGRVGLGDEAAGVEHQRVVRAGVIRLDLGQDRLDQVGVVDSGIEHVGRGGARCS